MSFFEANIAPALLPASRARDTSNRDSAIESEVLALFDLTRTRLLLYAISFSLPNQDGEDVVQETFLALFRHLQRGGGGENLQGWLFRVTHNLALKRRLANLARHNSEDHLDTADHRSHASGPTPEELLLFGERHATLQSALIALPQVDQACLRLRAEGVRYREIAKILDISLGSVSASIVRSMARLERADRR